MTKEEELQFEFDEEKSKSNKEKHGIDFIESQKLWQDKKKIEVDTNYKAELRTVVIARIDGKHYTAVITKRGENTRIISVRRARKKEVSLYEQSN